MKEPKFSTVVILLLIATNLWAVWGLWTLPVAYRYQWAYVSCDGLLNEVAKYQSREQQVISSINELAEIHELLQLDFIARLKKHEIPHDDLLDRFQDAENARAELNSLPQIHPRPY